MPTLKLDTTALAAIGAALIAGPDAGAGPGLLEVYDGAMPATVATALSGQVKLGTLTLSDPCASYAAGVVTFGAITQDAAADASGTAAWCRITDSAGVARMLLDAGNAGSTAAVKFNTTTIVQGGPIQVTSLTITIGG